MRDRFQPLDVPYHLRLGVDHIYACLNPEQGYRPPFQFHITGSSLTCTRHRPEDCPHVVGRFVDALARCAEIIEMPDEPEATQGLRALLHRSLDNPSGFAFDDMTSEDIPVIGAWMHHQRETLLALIGMVRWMSDDKSAKLARRLCRALEECTRANGSFPGTGLTSDGWDRSPGFGDMISGPSTAGRMIRALLEYYQVLGDPIGLEVARRFADFAMAHYFTEEGELTEKAGTHLHSIAGTVTNLIDFGILVRDHRYIDHGKRVLEKGLKPHYTSFGWVRASVSASLLAETNNTTDVLQAALLLGRLGWPDYLATAERFARNHLTACQMIDMDWLLDNATGPESPDLVYGDMRWRTRGGFCFATPNDICGYNSDLTGGALQGLCEFWHAIAAEEPEGVRINLLVSKDSGPASVESHLPREGRVVIRMRKAATLWVRIPSWVDKEQVDVLVDSRPATPQWQSPYMVVHGLGEGAAVSVTFPVRHVTVQETVTPPGETYTVDWAGDTLVGISPPGTIMSLY